MGALKVDNLHVCDFSFEHIYDIAPEKEIDDNIKAFYPQNKYENSNDLVLHKYGKGPFCRFAIPRELRREGIYLIKIDEEIKYVGECENLANRFNLGYGNISPRNCFVGGQSTNCRINNEIYKNSINNYNVELYFYDTTNRFEVEWELINTLSPSWNRSKGKKVENRNSLDKSTIPSKQVSYKKSTCREEILTVVRTIVGNKGVNEFTVSEVVKFMLKNDSGFKESTIRTHITSKCCVNAPSHHAIVYSDFERISKGLYKLINNVTNIK